MAQELRHQLHIMFYMKVPRSDHQLRLLTLTNAVLPGEAATWPGQLVLINQLGGLNSVPGFQCQSLNHLGTLESEMGVENSWFVKNVHGQKAGSWWKNIKRKLGVDAKAKTRSYNLPNQSVHVKLAHSWASPKTWSSFCGRISYKHTMASLLPSHTICQLKKLQPPS